MKKPDDKRPLCPKCGKEMRLVATTRTARSFFCFECRTVKIEKRDDGKEAEG
jgi:hypothetical protein